jgi:hypothetical protein
MMEERIRSLEERVTRLEASNSHTAEVAGGAVEAHQHNVTLLNTLRQTQLEQGAKLRDLAGMLTDHTFMLHDLCNTQLEHGSMLTDHTRRLDGLAADVTGLKTDVAELNTDVKSIKGTIGKITMGCTRWRT